jgi:hypothetical protein
VDVLILALFLTLHAPPDTTHADAFVAAEPCRARWATGEHAIGPAPEAWTILRCRVDADLRGTWFLRADDGWYRHEAPGVWARIAGEP